MNCLEWLKLLVYWIKQSVSRPHTDKHVTKTDSGLIVQFTVDDKQYKLFVPKKKNSIVLCITDEVGRDVTDDVMPLLGPNRDCYSTSFTPRDLGYTILQIETATETKQYGQDQRITL